MTSSGELMEPANRIAKRARAGVSARRVDPPATASASCALEAANRLNNLRIAGRKYVVIRDSWSRGFVVAALHQTTGAILDQFAPEQILKMIDRLSPFNKCAVRNTGDMKA